MPVSRPFPLLLAALLSVGVLTACDRSADETVGETLDRSVEESERRAAETGAQVERQAQEAQQDSAQATAGLRADANQATADATQAVQEGARQAGNAVDDAAITASVKTDLVRDPDLSALRINVDTSGGEVTLRGEADTAAAKERAEKIATSVKGVTKVRNELTVKDKS